jgi:TolB-like protein
VRYGRCRDQGIKIWYDTQIQAGSEWSDALANAIGGCSRFLYFITPNSVASENCRRELTHAMAERRSILAVHLLETEVPGGIRLNLNNRQAILKHRLKLEDYRSSLLGALSIDGGQPEMHATTAQPSSRGPFRLTSAIAATLLVVFAVMWLWQRSSPEPPMSETATGTGAPLTSIAVLPLDDLSPDADQGWLVNGMADDLIEALSRIETLHVPARRSTAILKESGAGLATIGERLEVGSVIEGSVRRVGEQLSVVARWIRVDDGSRLWSGGPYNRQMDDVLAIQKEIAVGIAEAVRAELDIQDAPPWAFSQRYLTSDVRAWELVKKAARLTDNERPELAQARDSLLLAVKYDPEFAEAWARLAWIDYLGGHIERGVEGLRDVLRKDPSNVAALRGLAYDSAARLWDYETAEWLLDLVPPTQKTSWVLELEFHLKAYTGRLDEALQAAERAVRLDPMWARAHCFVGYAHDWDGDSALAMQAYERAFSVSEMTHQLSGKSCNWDLIRIYLTLGRESEVEAIALSTPWISPHWEAIRRGWESGGWKGMNLAFDEGTPPDGDPLGRSCRYEPLAFAGASERLYECLESEFEATAVEVPASDFRQTLRRLVMAQNRAKATLVYRSYLAEPRLQDLLSRIEERMSEAAGTYGHQVDLSFLR